MPSLYCGHCRKYHFNVNQVRQCSALAYAGGKPAPVKPQTLPALPQTFRPINTQPVRRPSSNPIKQVVHKTEPATDAQLYGIRRRAGTLGLHSTEADRMISQAVNRQAASNIIDSLETRIKGMTQQQAIPTPAATEYVAPESAFLPKNMMDMIRPGRYAVKVDGNLPWVFLRISIGTKSARYPGGLKIQTQHSENLIDRLVYEKDGRMRLLRRDKIQGQELSDLILVLITDQTTAAIAYGQELEQCCRCGIHLTEPKSKHYGIGPECEKHWPWIIETVNDTRGEYVPGQAE